MAIVVTAQQNQQIEIILPDGRIIEVIVKPENERPFRRCKIVFKADLDIQIRRVPRKPYEPGEDN